MRVIPPEILDNALAFWLFERAGVAQRFESREPAANPFDAKLLVRVLRKHQRPVTFGHEAIEAPPQVLQFR